MSQAFSIAVVYDSGKRYIVPFDLLKKVVDDETIDKIKTEALKQVKKL